MGGDDVESFSFEQMKNQTSSNKIFTIIDLDGGTNYPIKLGNFSGTKVNVLQFQEGTAKLDGEYIIISKTDGDTEEHFHKNARFVVYTPGGRKIKRKSIRRKSHRRRASRRRRR